MVSSKVDQVVKHYKRVDKLNEYKRACLISINRVQSEIYRIARELACDCPEVAEKLIEIGNRLGECANEVNLAFSNGNEVIKA